MFSYAKYSDLKNKVVVVTGGGSGIGAEIVRAFVDQGSKVFFLDIARTDGETLQKELELSETPPRYYFADLTDLNSIASVMSEIHERVGKVDVLINNCANDDRHKLEDVTSQYWENRMAVNLRHLYFCSQAVVGGMRESGGGVILNLGSISWHLALPNLSLYMTAKAAIEGMTRGLARDLGNFGIRVNCIVPGAVRTQRQIELWHTPEEELKILAGQCLKERVEVQDVAAMTLFLSSSNGAKCSGRNYFVDAGWFGA